MKTILKLIIVLVLVSTNIHAEVRAKVSTAACPSENMYKGFIEAGSISSGMRTYPSCRVIYKGTLIKKIIDRSWSTAKVIWIDINGNSRVDYVSIESVR